MHTAIFRFVGFLSIAFVLCRCGWSQSESSAQQAEPAFLQDGAWQAHTVEQLNGKEPRINSSAGIQIITQPWDMGPVYYPYMVYMPDRDRLLMLLGFGQEIKAGVVWSDDRGATWTRPQKIADGWGIGLTYLDGGEAVLKTRNDNRYWFSDDFGANWDRSVAAAPCEDGKLFYADSSFFVDRDPESGRAIRLWATGKKSDLACLLRYSDDRGKTWSQCRHVPQWGRTSEIVLHRADNGNLLAACRVNLPQFEGQIDHLSGLGVSVSKDNGQTWSELNVLYAWGRHMSSMVTLDNGDIALTYIARKGYVDTVDGFPQFGVEAVISRDHGLTWDLDHRYLLAVWRGNRKSTEPMSWQAGPQRTTTVLLPDKTLITAFGTGYRTLGNQGQRTHSPQDIAIVRWRVGDGKVDDDRTIANAPVDSDQRNVFDPKISRYAMQAAIEVGRQKQRFVDDDTVGEVAGFSQVPDPSRHLRVLRPNKLPDSLPARRISLGAGYKPTLARLPDGELVMMAFFWKKDEGYHEYSKLWRSTDGGKTWPDPVRVELSPGRDLLGRENWLTVIDDGSPRGLLFSTNHILHIDGQNPTPGTSRSTINRSTDGGVTWIQTLLPSEWSHTSRNVIKMPDGSLKVGANNVTGGNNRWLTSTDAGMTWTESPLNLPHYRNYQGKRMEYDNRVGFFQESFTYVNAAGELLQWIRLDGGSSMFPLHDEKPTGNDQVDRMIYTKSTDGGSSWSDVVDCPGYGGNLEPYGQMYPRVIQLADGRMLLTFTNRSGVAPLGLRAVLSTDGGATFDFKQDLLILDENTPKGWTSGGGFGNTIQLPDGGLISCYSYATTQFGNQHPHIEVIHWRLP